MSIRLVEAAARRAAAASTSVRDAVVAAHREGASVTDLAKEAGVTRQTIYRWITA